MVDFKFFRDNRLGIKGHYVQEFLKPGYVFAPFIPITTAPEIFPKLPGGPTPLPIIIFDYPDLITEYKHPTNDSTMAMVLATWAALNQKHNQKVNIKKYKLLK